MAKATQLVHCRAHLGTRSPISPLASIFSRPRRYSCAIIIITITCNLPFRKCPGWGDLCQCGDDLKNERRTDRE